jgi:hypothetical protein
MVRIMAPSIATHTAETIWHAIHSFADGTNFGHHLLTVVLP